VIPRPQRGRSRLKARRRQSLPATTVSFVLSTANSSNATAQRMRHRLFRHTIRIHPTQALGHLMRNDEQHVWVVSKVAFAPIVVSRLRHFATDRAGKETVEWEFGNVSSSRGIHFRISTVSILKSKRVSSVVPTSCRGCATGPGENVENRFPQNPGTCINN